MSYPWLVRSTATVYCVDREFGPFFLKFRTYFPYTAKLFCHRRRVAGYESWEGPRSETRHAL